jgi:uncharacterized ion transporter superfamily protein YfcC
VVNVEKNAKRKFEMPHGFIILLLVIAFCAVLTWVLPAGSFERVLDEKVGRELVVPGSYKLVEANPVGLWDIFKILYTGMVEAADIIFFIIFAAAYVFTLMKTGTLNAMVGAVLRKLGSKDYLLIPIFMLIFGIAGATFGMYEETFGLIPAFIVIGITLGYDRILGSAIVFVGVATGFAAAVLNPFTIGIASAVAGIPLVSYKITLFRIVCFILFMALSITYVMLYARKIRKDPTKSIMYGSTENNEFEKNSMSREEVLSLPFTVSQKISLSIFVVLLCLIGYGVTAKGFYLTELAAMFLIAMIITGIVNKMSSRQICDAFIESSQIMIYGALFVGLSRSAAIVLTQGSVIDTVVLYLSNAINGLPGAVTSIGMLIVQNIIGFIITSGSGMAVVTMPIMAPLADLVGMSREMSVTAYQFGDGFSNMFTPIGVAMMCGIMGISMDKWYRFITPLFAMMVLLQAIMMIVGGFIF